MLVGRSRRSMPSAMLLAMPAKIQLPSHVTDSPCCTRVPVQSLFRLDPANIWLPTHTCSPWSKSLASGNSAKRRCPPDRDASSAPSAPRGSQTLVCGECTCRGASHHKSHNAEMTVPYAQPEPEPYCAKRSIHQPGRRWRQKPFGHGGGRESCSTPKTIDGLR